MFPIEEGLRGWEIVATAAVCGVGWLAVSSAIAFTMAWFFTRERAPAQAEVAPKSQPVPTAPTHATPAVA